MKQKILFSAFILAQVFILVPLLIYVPNRDEFNFGYLSLLQQILLPYLVGLIMLSGILFILPKRLGAWVLALGAALSLCIYVQSNLLIWDYGLFDGVPIPWKQFETQGWVDCGVWAFIVFVVLLKRKWFAIRAHMVSALMCILQLISCVPAIVSADATWLFAQLEKRTEQFSNFSKHKNAIVILLDGFSSPAFSEIIENHPEHKQHLSDFVYFKNTISHFPTTMLSVPSILTGSIFDASENVETYLKRSLSTHSIPVALENEGFDVGVKTLRKFCHFLGVDPCMGFTMGRHRSEESQKLKEALEILDVSFFRATPQPVKRRIYRNQLWWLRRMKLPWDDRQAAEDPHLQFMDELIESMTANENEPVFRFIHMLIPHYPIRFDAECKESERHIPINKRSFAGQSRCGLKLVHTFIERLKSLGVYDQSLVMVVADHGNDLDYGLSDKKYREEHNLIDYGRNLPLLLVKLPNAHHEFQISEVPAAISDVPATIVDVFKVSTPIQFGTSLFSLQPDQKRARQVRHIPLRLAMLGDGIEGHSLKGAASFEVQGNAWAQESWIRFASIK